MIAFYLSPLYFLVSVYLVWRLNKWVKTWHDLFNNRHTTIMIIVVYTFFASTLLVGFLLKPGLMERTVKILGNYWLGVLLYSLIVLGVAEILAFLLKLTKMGEKKEWNSKRVHRIAGEICCVCIAAFCIGGTINARIIRTTHYETTVEKSVPGMQSLNVVLVADLHMGYNIGCEEIQRMVDKINAQNPDVVVIAGDIFDNSYEALDDPDRIIEILKGIKSKHGIYACYGNHDIEEKILAGFTFGSREKKTSDERMDALLEKAGIQLLKDEYVLIENEIYLYGRPDAQRPGRGIEKRKTPEEVTAQLDKSKPIIVIDHQPRELEALAGAGVDIDLCGHTHDGQTFPGNLTTRLMWENSCGYMKVGQMDNYVTSGVGVFGPFMRVGANPEICQITIHFK